MKAKIENGELVLYPETKEELIQAYGYSHKASMLSNWEVDITMVTDMELTDEEKKEIENKIIHFV